MIGMLAYGSLIHPQEFACQVGVVSAVPVQLTGFRRVFNQKPSWREGEGNHIGVLNVEASSRHWINAICLNLEKEETKILKTREQGYTRVPVLGQQIACYPGYRLPSNIDFCIYVGKQGKKDSGIFPNNEYLELCINGAETWGMWFCDDFLTTTYLASGTVLHEYIADQRKDLKNALVIRRSTALV